MLKSKISGSIGIGSAWSQAAITDEYTIAGLVFSGSVVTGSQVSFLVSNDGVNYIPLFGETGSEVLVTVSASPKAYNLKIENFRPWNMVKLRLGYSASSVNQATYPLLFDFMTVSD